MSNFIKKTKIIAGVAGSCVLLPVAYFASMIEDTITWHKEALAESVVLFNRIIELARKAWNQE